MAVITPHDPACSKLIQKIIAEDETERMPPVKSGRKLSDSQVKLLVHWVAQGAKWQKHWSLTPAQRSSIPKPRDGDRSRNPVDAFILERLDREGISPSAEAAKTTLIRRVTLDLTGLPPTLAEIDAFLADETPDAYERVVDRLLASPRYGERMLLEWLDASRYADTNGFQGDRTRMNWPWRDWVIDALNRNMPFDQFTVEQLAGDLLPDATIEQKIATGFNRNHMLNGEGGRIPEEARVDYVVDRVDTTATVWLGLTLGCARCHDHKYDPISQKDYYQLYAYFNNVAESGAVEGNGLAPPWLRVPSKEQETLLAKLTQQKSEADNAVKRIVAELDPHRITARRTAVENVFMLFAAGFGSIQIPDHLLASAEWKTAAARVTQLRHDLEHLNRAIPLVMVMDDRKEPRETHVLVRGAYDKYGEIVRTGLPTCIPLHDSAPLPNRLGLARWLTDPRNPLTARVTVNRYWQQFFGVGLVKTAEDFGAQGEWPSHPELLDWLAVECVESGWDVKHLHRLIVNSSAYRQSSSSTTALNERDPDNRLIARGPRHRLPSALIRDQALAVSGLLVERFGGPPTRPYQPPGIWEEMTFGFIKYEQDKGPNLFRRSGYTFWRRTVGPTTLFDSNTRQICAVRGARTNSPLHALTLLNDITYVEAARALAERALSVAAQSDLARIQFLFRVATSRLPTNAEQDILLTRLRDLRRVFNEAPHAADKLLRIGDHPRRADLDTAELAAYTGVASVVLNLDEVQSKE